MALRIRQPFRGIRELGNRARNILPSLLPPRIRRVWTRTPYGNPLPPRVNKVLRESDLRPGRLLIVGDVHGCYDELEQLLEKANFNAGTDNLILAGDLVNKGPASDKVLQLMRQLGPSAHAVRGNHDDHLLSVYNRWVRSGGQEPVKERHTWVTQLSKQDAAVLAQLPFTISIPAYGVIVVHALLVPGKPLEEIDMWAALHARNLALEAPVAGPAQGPMRLMPWQMLRLNRGAWGAKTAEGALEAVATRPRALRWKPLEAVDEGGQPWAKHWEGPQHVVFGHDARRRLQLEPLCTGLDTGCLYGGELTALVLPPLARLRAASPLFVLKQREGRPPTREDLLGELVSVPAARAYAEVKRKAPKQAEPAGDCAAQA